MGSCNSITDLVAESADDEVQIQEATDAEMETKTSNFVVTESEGQTVVYIPLATIAGNMFSEKSSWQTQLVTHPTDFLVSFGHQVCETLESKKLLFLRFDDKFTESQQLHWCEYIKNFINVIIRRTNYGNLIGITQLAKQKSDEVQLVLSQQIMDNYIYTPHSLNEEEVFDILIQRLCSSYDEKQCLIEFIYDPLYINPSEIQRFLKNSQQAHEFLGKKYERSFSSLRKMNAHSLFSFTFLLFTLDNIEDVLNGESNADLEIAEYHEFKYDNSFENLKHQSFFSNLIFNTVYRKFMLYILDQMSKYAEYVEVPLQLKFKDSYVSIFSEIMSFEYQEFKNYMLVVSQIEGQYVCKVEIVKNTDSYRQKTQELLSYLCNQIPEQYRKLVGKIYEFKTTEGASQEDNENKLENDEKLVAIIDSVMQEYLFRTESEFTVDISQFDEDFVQKNMMAIKTRIEENLLLGDQVTIGISADEEAFIKIIKREIEVERLKTQGTKKRVEFQDRPKQLKPKFVLEEEEQIDKAMDEIGDLLEEINYD